MKILLSSIFLLLLILDLAAQQTFEWGVKAGGVKEDLVNDIVCLGKEVYVTGNFTDTISSGNSKVTAAGMTDIFFTRIDENGKTDWIKSVGGSGADNATCLAAGDKCVYMGGELNGAVKLNKQEYPGKGKALFVASWNKSGKINWLTKFGYTGNATLDILETAPDGTLLAGGMLSGSLQAGDKILDSQFGRRAYVLSISPEGQLTKALLTNGKGDHRLVAAKHSEGGFSYLLFNVRGWMAMGNDETLFSKNEDFTGLVLVKDSIGQPQWVKYFRGNNYLQGVKLAIGQDKSISACINYSGTLIAPTDTITSINALQDVVLFNYNPEGKLNWMKQLRSPVMCYAMDAISTKSGKLMITGYYRKSYYSDKDTVLAENQGQSKCMFLAQFDKNGRLTWHNEAGEEASGFSRAVAIDLDGDLFMAGGFKGDLAINGKRLKSDGEEDVVVAKYFNCGQLNVEITGAGPLCEGSFRELKATPGNFETYIWNDSVWGREFIVTSPGAYTVEAFDEKGCSARDTVQIDWAFNPEAGLPPVTDLTPGGQLQLTANEGFISYVWSDGHIGATRMVNYDEAADSSVFILNAETQEGCLIADTAVVRFVRNKLKVAGIRTSSWHVYPNPVSDFLWWYMDTDTPTKIQVTLNDERGATVYSETIDKYLPHSRRKIDVGALTSGNYILNLVMGETILNEKIVKK